jgi:hypothetical protein
VSIHAESAPTQTHSCLVLKFGAADADGLPGTGLIDRSFCTWEFVNKKELSPKQMLALTCPTCGAAPGERCELSTGQPRDNPHVDRRLIAKD